MFCTSTATAAPFSSLSTVVLTTLTSLFGFGIVKRLLRLDQRLPRGTGLGGLVLGGLACRKSHRPQSAQANRQVGRKPQPNAPLTYSRVRFALGAPKTSSERPYSTRSPRYMKATSSATR